MNLHPTITEDRIIDAFHRRLSALDNPGFCNACGEEAEGCEPDAEEYRCQFCGRPTVYGEEILLLMVVA